MQTVNYSDYIYYAGTTQPVVRVPVYVYETNTTNLASLYDSTGAAIDNPTQTDDNGLFDFWTTFGKYDLYVHNTKEFSISLANLAYVYLGIYDTNPTERPDGTPLQDGDMYFNSVINHTKLYNNGLWYYADDMMNASGVAYDPASGPQTDVQTQMRDYDTHLYTIDSHLDTIDSEFDVLYSEDGSDEIGFIQDGVDAVATTVQTKLRETVSVKDFGAVGDGVTDDTAAIQAAIDYCATGSGHALFWPAGSYLVTNLTASGVVDWKGDSKDTVNVFSVSSGNLLTAIKTGSGFSIDAIDLSIKDMSFNSGSGQAASDHCLYIERYIRLVLEDVTIFGAGKSGIYMTECFVMRLNRIYGLFCGQNAASSGDAVIRYVRTTTGNSLYIQNSYISNSIGTDGVKVNTCQNISLSNVTLESCDTLVNLGASGTASRNIRLENIYCENAAVSHIDLQAFVGASLENIYINPTGAREATVYRGIGLFDVYDNVTLRNISVVGTPGSGNTDWLSPYEFNVRTGNVAGTQYVGQGIEMFGCQGNDTITLNDNGTRYAVSTYTNPLGILGVGLGIEKTHTQLLSSADISTWAVTGAATVTPNSGAFYDGATTYTVAGTTATNIAITTSTTYSTGENLCFSTFAWGSGKILLRGRRTSDSVFEDVAEFYVRSDEPRRVWASALLTKDYNSFICRITPNTSITAVYPQLEKAIVPSKYA